MQSIAWYIRRLRAMSLPEIGWRVSTALRRSVDRRLASLRRTLPALPTILRSGAAPGDWATNTICPHIAPPGKLGPLFDETWRAAVVAEAEAILAGRVRLLGNHEVQLAPNDPWNHEYNVNRPTPLAWAPDIDYRDFQQTGDCKWVWELNRCHHLVVLGRAYRVSGDRRFAAAVAKHIDEWITHCPFGYGMNWRSPLEIAIRIINWAWALTLVQPAESVDERLAARIAASAHQHLWEIDRNYSRFSSANNHLVGEAAGVYIGSAFFSCLKDAEAWRRRSRQILLREIQTQILPDGGHCELAVGYHLFVLQFFLLAANCARNVGETFPKESWRQLEKMFDFLGWLAQGGPLPMLGDADDGYVLHAGGPRYDPAPWLAVAAAEFRRPDFKAQAGLAWEPICWLLGEQALTECEQLDVDDQLRQLESHGFPDSGVYLLQSGWAGQPGAISITVDCGPLGFGSLAAHGHADALSFTLRVGGHDVFVDPGTFDYFSFPAWRSYFRGTLAHNTVMVDDENQSEMLGPFLWGRRAGARVTLWRPDVAKTVLTAEHDGYRRLADPVRHERTIRLHGATGRVEIEDRITADRDHDLAICFHLAETCSAEPTGDNQFRISGPGGIVDITLDSSLEILRVKGAERPILGWVSRGYHQRKEATTLIGRKRARGLAVLRTGLSVHGPGSPARADF